MGRRFDRGDERDRIAIEVADVEPVAGRDLSSWRSPARALGLVAFGVAIGVVLAGIFLGGGDTNSSPTSTASAPISPAPTSPTTAPRPQPTSPVSTGTVSTSAVSTSPASTSTSVPEVLLPFGHATGIVLYLTPEGGAPTGIVAFDVDTAQRHPLDLGRDVGWYIRAIDGAGGVVIDGGAVLAVAHGGVQVIDAGSPDGYQDAPTGRTALGPAGGLWIRRIDPPRVDLLDADGSPTATSFPLPSGADLFGSMADGRPVVRGADGRLFVVGVDGQRTLLASNALAPVDAGRFAEARCTDDQHCTLVAHIDDQTYDLGPTLGAHGNHLQVRFQPGGSMIAIVDGSTLTVLDPVAGQTVVDVNADLEPSFFIPDDPPVRFLPDNAGLVTTTRDGLRIMDLHGRTVTTIPRKEINMPGPTLLGVGQSTPWVTP